MGSRRAFLLELDAASERLSGSLRDERGQDVAFSGWLGFASALERMLDGPGRAERLPAASAHDPPTGSTVRRSNAEG